MKIIHFFNKNKNKQQTPYNTNNLSSDDDDYYQPDIFAPYTNEYRTQTRTMKLEETENLKLQYVNRIETNTTHINKVQESDTDLIEKITEILNIYERNPNFKGKPKANQKMV